MPWLQSARRVADAESLELFVMEAQDEPIAHFERMSKLGQALKALPAQILEHSYSYESFGSWSLVFRYKGQVHQIIYDDRDDHVGLRGSADRKPPYRYGLEKSLGTGAGLSSLDAAAIEEICRVIML